MKPITLFSLLLAPLAFFSQQWIWAKDIGKYSNAAPPSIKSDASGNAYTAATSLFQPSTLIIKKENTQGTVLWSNTIHGDNTMSSDMCVDKNNHCYVLGSYANNLVFADTTYFNNGDWERFIVAFDAAGNRKWVKTKVKAGYITNDINANVITAGGGSDTFTVTKYSPAGNFIWKKMLAVSAANLNSITCDKHNNIYLGGVFTHSLTIDGTTYYPNQGGPYWKSFVAKLDAAGSVKKVQILEGAQLFCFKLDSTSADIYANGVFDDTLKIGQYKLISACATSTSMYCSETFLVRFDTSNNVHWAKKGLQNLKAIDVSKAGDVYITGNFGDTLKIDSAVVAYPQQRWATFIAKINKAGALQWAKTDTGGYMADIWLYNISHSESGANYITGNFHNYNTQCWFGNTTMPYTGFDTHYFSAGLMENSLVTSLMPARAEDKPLLVFPNPTNGKIRVSGTVSAIYDVLGNNIFNRTYSSNEIDLSENPKGVYFVEIKYNDGKIVKKIILE